jgi:hypothetical protein
LNTSAVSAAQLRICSPARSLDFRIAIRREAIDDAHDEIARTVAKIARSSGKGEPTPVRLHHLYRAMAWLGEDLAEQSCAGRAPRRTKDPIEEQLFAHRKSSDLSAVLFALCHQSQSRHASFPQFVHIACHRCDASP